MPAPVWLAATTGFQGAAGQVNQFLATHAITYVPTGVLQANQQTAGSGAVDSNGLWIAQSFATAAGQTSVGYAVVTAAVTGSPAAWTFSIQGNSSGAPSGVLLASAAVPKEFLTSSPSAQAVMLPYAGLSPSTTYWIVAQAVGDASDFFAWSKSNQVSGASTSTNGTSWTAQSYGLLFEVFDQSEVAPLAGIWEDSGARWTALTYTSGELTGVEEYTAGQTANGYAASARGLAYTGNQLAGVA